MEEKMGDLNELLQSTEEKLSSDIDAKYEDNMNKIKKFASEIGDHSNRILQSNNRMDKVYIHRNVWYVHFKCLIRTAFECLIITFWMSDMHILNFWHIWNVKHILNIWQILNVWHIWMSEFECLNLNVWKHLNIMQGHLVLGVVIHMRK